MDTIINGVAATGNTTSSTIRIKEEVKGYSFHVIRTGGDAAITVDIQGSNDDTNYFVIDTQSVAAGTQHMFRGQYFGCEYVQCAITGAGTTGTVSVIYNKN